MKQITLLFAIIISALATLAQMPASPKSEPQGIIYQTVIRDSEGSILPNKEISMQMTIRTGMPDGEVVYQETHDDTTSAFGLVDLIIGYGVPVVNTFADINWGDGDKYLETAIDIDGGSNFTVMGVTQFFSVPYALYSQKAENIADGETPGELLFWDGAEWNSVEPGEHNQTLRLCNGVPTWGECKYNLTVLADPQEAGNVEGEGKYFEGEDITLTATANPGWYFINWIHADTVISDSASFVFNMPAKFDTLTAIFLEEQSTFTCGESFYDYRDGQSYETVLIGEQCWMVENLKYLPKVNTPSDGSDLIPKYYVYDYNGTSVAQAKASENYQNFGVLYNWSASMQDVCPQGWHLPSKPEWEALSLYVRNQPEFYCEDQYGSFAGIAKALADSTYWNNTSTYDCTVGNNPSANNATGFSGLPGGYRAYYTNFGGINDEVFWWTSTGFGDLNAWWAGFEYDKTDLEINNNVERQNGYSVRCVSDSTVITPKHNLNLNVNPTEAGTVNGAGQYQAGEEIPISATANAGWEFLKWTNGDTLISETASFTFNMPAWDNTLTAHFVVVCGDSLTDPRDGRKYSTVQIGEQCWMAENLAYLPEVSPSSQGNPPGSVDPYYYVYDYQGYSVEEAKATANYQTFGVLYNAHAAHCPEGWHVPFDEEWTKLTNYVSSLPEYNCNDNADYIAKSLASSTYWSNDTATCAVGNNQSGNNATGFSGLPGGNRLDNGDFDDLNHQGYWWAANDYMKRELTWYSPTVNPGTFAGDGLSVRCLRDKKPPPVLYNLNLETNPIGAGEVSGAGQYEAGEEISIAATTNTGWRFINWLIADSAISETENYTFTMPGHDVTITANFTNTSVCGDSFTDPRDGQTYEIVQIGERCWMAENLNIGSRIDGSEEMTDNGTIEKYCYDNDPANCETYGGLYQWDEMMAYIFGDNLTGICPEGWRVPNDADWCVMEWIVDSTIICNLTGERGVDGGGKLKESGTLHWSFPNSGATNIFGFTALPGGYIYTGNFNQLTHEGNWWTSTKIGDTKAVSRRLFTTETTVASENEERFLGFSVRCIKGQGKR